MAIEFPRIPEDQKSQDLIQMMGQFAGFMLMTCKDSIRAKKVAGILNTVASTVYDDPYAYFRLHQGLCEDYQSLSDWYNYDIWAEGPDFMMETLEREAEEFMPVIMPFQFTMKPFAEKAKVDERWAPLGAIWWMIWTCMYSSKKMDELIDTFERVLKDIDDERDQQRRAMLN